MLKAKLDSVRKNKKGFSLVELIIVIAIMVALIAVMAPAFVKYVQKSRDAALATAAEDFEKAVQTFAGDPDTDPALLTNGSTIVIKVAAGGSDGVTGTDTGKFYLSITKTGTLTDDTLTQLITLAGADRSKPMGKTDKQYTISIANTNGDVSISMAESTVSGG